MSVIRRALLAGVLIAAVSACASYSSPTSPSGGAATATITSSGFNPTPINVALGSPVTWTNQDSVTRSIVADNGAFSSGAIAPGAKFSYAFPASGTFTYHDASNLNMKGTVIVSGSSNSRY